jgi:hypothetical protein
MRKPFRLRGFVGVVLVAGVGAAFSASPAFAARSPLTLVCNGQQVTVLVNNNHSSQNGGWGSAHIVSGGSGTGSPVAFSGQLVDTTADQTLLTFNSAKGKGNAEHNQQSISCTQTLTGTVGDFVPPDMLLPPGVSLGDQATFNLSVTVVPKGHTTIG